MREKKVVNFMKKIVPVLAVLGSAVAYAVYKMKKDDNKKMIAFDNDQTIENNSQCEMESEPTIYSDHEEEVSNILKEVNENNETSLQDAIQSACESDEIENIEEPVVNEDTQLQMQYPHLTCEMIHDIKTMTKDAIVALASDGDVHTNERPVQHMVSFSNQEDLETFKSTVINKGFVITKGEEEHDLVVLHISTIDEEKLINNILYLANKAYELNGEYRGWQSKISF